MKKSLTFAILTFFLIGFVFAASDNSNSAQVSTQNSGEESQIQTQEQTEAGDVDAYRARVIQRIQNRLQNTTPSNCPEDCTCSGAVTQCRLQDGTRELTIRAGNSGNTIVQMKGQNMSTNVSLFKAEGKVYGVFQGNQTRAIEVLPDQVQEKIRERIQSRLENHSMELDEDGNYQIEARKRARLFGFIPIREKVKMQMNSETGEITRVRNSWWGFLAKDEAAEETAE